MSADDDPQRDDAEEPPTHEFETLAPRMAAWKGVPGRADRRGGIGQDRGFADERSADLLLVADGLPLFGGQAAEIVVNHLSTSWSAPNREGEGWTVEQAKAWLGDRISEAHSRVLAQQKSDGNRRETTVTAAIRVGKRQWVLAHVGDSRAYRWHLLSLTQITTDHTMAQRYVEEGKIPQDKVKDSPLRNCIENVVGRAGSHPVVYFYEVDLEEDDVLLLCTDGLTYIDLAAALQVAVDRYGRDALAICAYLTEQVQKAGAPDDATVALAFS